MEIEDDSNDELSQIAQAPSQPKPPPSLGPNQQFRDEIAKRESRGQPDSGYGAPGPQLGRYQMKADALIDAGLKDKNGAWTGKYGTNSDADFLRNRNGQDLTFADYMKKVESYLKNNGSTKRIGQQVDGSLAKFSITEGGLLAAAHRMGQGAVKDYLEWQERNNWKSDFNTLPQDVRKKFEPVEARLREFERIPYR